VFEPVNLLAKWALPPAVSLLRLLREFLRVGLPARSLRPIG
jgi:hypothetical protein